MSNHRRSSFPYTHHDGRNIRILGEAATTIQTEQFQDSLPLRPIVNVNASQVAVAELDHNIDAATSAVAARLPLTGVSESLGGYEVPGPGPPVPPVSNPVVQVHSHQQQHPTFGVQDDQRPQFQHLTYGHIKLEPPSFEVFKSDGREFVSPHQQFSSPEQTFNPPPRAAPAAPPLHGLSPGHHPFYGHGLGHHGHHGQSADQDPSQNFGAGAGSVPSFPAGWLGHAGMIQESPHSGVSTIVSSLAQHHVVPNRPPQLGPPPQWSGPPLQPHFHGVQHPDHHDRTFRHHQYPPKRTPSVSSDQSAPYMTDLHLLLSPDQPDDGVRRLQAAPDASRRSSQTSAGREDTSPPKKRSNTQLADGPDPDEGSKKRIRGRPRVEASDQTPADRRRTQIRLAQRAYRNRKEEALQTLEKQVDDLQKNNEEMTKAFMQLQDLAIQQGLLQSAPEFGRQLKATSEKFLALANRVTEDASKDDASSPEQDQDGNDGSSGGHSRHHMRIPSSSPDTSSISSRKLVPLAFGSAPLPRDDPSNRSTQPMQVPFGYQVSAPITSAAPAADPTVGPPTALDAGTYQAGTSLGALDASLGPLGGGGAADPGSVLDPLLLSVLSGGGPSMSPFSTVPPVPASYSYQERTFGRRLQRAALEQGLLLAKMDNPPPQVYAAVFGFCLLFEPRESIIRRLTNCIRSNHDETLHNWRFPFFHLGGAGTFFDALVNDSTDYSGLPSTASPTSAASPDGGSGSGGAATAATSPGDARPIGNQGMREPWKPAQSAGFGMGPFNADIEETRDMRVDAKMRITVPGFEGTFFDPDEIEFYLRQRGVYIPPAADFVTAEIDPNDFSDETSDGSVCFSAADSIGISKPTTIRTVATSLDAALIDPLPTMAGTMSTGFPQFGGPATASDFGSTGMLDISPMVSALTPSPMLSDNLDLPADYSMMDSVNAFGPSVPSVPTESTKQKVTINVAMLVDELLWRSVCLGRAPGIRPKDVNLAFWRATTPA